jgi:hypothetical protein
MANRVSRTAEVRPAAAKRAALDGKAVRNACQCGSRTPCQLVIVCAIEARGALAECAAPGRKRDRGSAGFAVPRGYIITAGALHYHRAFAAAVLARGGDYVLAMKAYRGPYPDASCSRLGAPASAAAPSRSNRPATIGAKSAAQPSYAIHPGRGPRLLAASADDRARRAFVLCDGARDRSAEFLKNRSPSDRPFFDGDHYALPSVIG